MSEASVSASKDIAVRPQPAVPPPTTAAAGPRWWPGPAAAAGPVPVAAAAGAGVLAAGLVPLGRPGVGWALAGIAAYATIAAGLRRPATGGWRRAAPPGRWLERAAWGVAAVALLAVGAIRAAEWLFWLCLLAAAVALVPALTTGRTLRGLLLGGVLVPAAAGRGVAWAYRGGAALRQRVRVAIRIGPTVAITAVLLLVFGALFASADAAFSRLLGRAVPDLDADSVLRWALLFVVGAGVVLAAVFLLLAPPAVDRAGPARPGRREVRLVEWAIPVGALVVLFANFVAVQLTVLFGGAEYVLGPDGPDYAQYARGGFWQLLTVTALTLLVMGVTARVAPRHTPTEWWFLRGLLGALAVLSLVIVASALFRMHTYQEAYGFTRLRVLVSAVELWLGLVFVLVLAAGIRLRARWLPRAVVATGIATVLALAVLNPDRFIAERNLDRWAAGEQLDLSYLAGLSADAVPALVCLPDPERESALVRIRAALAEAGEDWRSANLSRTVARDLLAEPGCPPTR